MQTLNQPTNAPLTSKIILIFLSIISLGFATWAGSAAFADTMAPLAPLAMMGMMGYIFHAVIMIAALYFTKTVRKTILLLLLTWHIPEALLIGIFTMGVPDGRLTGVIIHSTFCVLALIAYYFESKQTSPL